MQHLRATMNRVPYEANEDRELADAKETKPGPITIKKYANRRLYNTASSSYVTLDHRTEDGKIKVTDYKSKGKINKRIYVEIEDA